MGEEVKRALSCLGKSFDVNSDFKLKYCKEEEEESARAVVLSPEKRGLVVPSFGAFEDVSIDIKCDKGERVRYQSGVLEFNQMSVFMNQRSGLDGKIPSGLFSSIFGFTGGSWVRSASNTRCLALDGCFISLFHLRIDRFPLVLSDRIAKAVPSTWDPASLASFIEKYGTHVIVGLDVGGREMVSMRQDISSKLQPLEIKEHLVNLGDQIFCGTCNISPLHSKNNKQMKQLPEAFDLFGPQPVIGDGYTRMSSKQGITVVWSKLGGDASSLSHFEWLNTISCAPEAINFTFVPITSLLKDVVGKGFLTHAINLYLRYKPPVADLERFLGFQSHRVWAPMLHDLPLGPCSNRSHPDSILQFTMMGPKLFVNTNQVVVGSTPVTGMRLYLEGKGNSRLAIHLQHLSATPSFLLGHLSAAQTRWRDPNSDDEAFFEPIQNKAFSHVCTAVVEHPPPDEAAATAFIVTGAQLSVDRHRGCRGALRLRLLYSPVSGHFVEGSAWEDGRSRDGSRRPGSSGFLSAISSTLSASFEKERPPPPAAVADSGVFAGTPPVPVREQKMLRFVHVREVSRGAGDGPGHWLATGARLAVDKGRVALHVKFSLLCPSSPTLP